MVPTPILPAPGPEGTPRHLSFFGSHFNRLASNGASAVGVANPGLASAGKGTVGKGIVGIETDPLVCALERELDRAGFCQRGDLSVLKGGVQSR